jgi:hypothetical protein
MSTSTIWARPNVNAQALSGSHFVAAGWHHSARGEVEHVLDYLDVDPGYAFPVQGDVLATVPRDPSVVQWEAALAKMIEEQAPAFAPKRVAKA